ncbi:MAG TPA: beta-ketoacyl-ACP synthase [Casimicrobiaceae bacterium]|nr:beta-ketoacyl-ACP synthase [Casimicrobiaceae bacterium]
MTSCLGRGLVPTRAAFRANVSGLAPCRFDAADLDTWVGEIAGLDDVTIPGALSRFDCRNNRASELGLGQDGFSAAVAEAASRYGPARAGVFIGTSTAGILQTELAYRRRDPASGALPPDFDYRRTHNTYSAAEYVRERLALAGPCVAISTACSSSAKAFASAARMLGAGLIDMAVVGGVDTLCLTTLYGFGSLQLLSSSPCRPYDIERDGISIGEAAAFFLLERSPGDESIALLGIGESSDAHHMSAPHPEGAGARRAMAAALASARLAPQAIDYVNLHGTGTPNNDAAEDIAVYGLFGDAVPVNSTKGMTGHALGAAGAVEAILSVIAIDEGRFPGSPGTRTVDPALHVRYEVEGCARDIACVLSNSFGFGGSNCSAIFGRVRAIDR